MGTSHMMGENMEIDLSEALGKTNKEIESHRDAKAPDRSFNDADCSNMDTAHDFNASKSQHMDSTKKYLINNTEIASESIVKVHDTSHVMGENTEIDLSEALAVDTKTIGEIIASSTTDISEDAATHPGLHVHDTSHAMGENME